MDHSEKKFEEALELLNEAALQKKDEIRNLINDKYTHLKDVLSETCEQNFATFNRVREAAEDVIVEGNDKIKETAVSIDNKVKKNPWKFIGGTALGALVMGFILGKSKKD